MSDQNYMLFCPINMACEILQPRWTIHILTEMRWGATRFNDIRRGVPGISATLLSKRLKTLQAQGLVMRITDPTSGDIDYLRTDAAAELDPIITELGKWAYRNRSVQDHTLKVDPSAFIWNLRLCLNSCALPSRRVIIKFTFPEQVGKQREFWIIHKPGLDVDVCFRDPSFDVDLFVTCPFDTLVSVFFGYSSLSHEIAEDRVQLIGHSALRHSIGQWLVLSSYARDQKCNPP